MPAHNRTPPPSRFRLAAAARLLLGLAGAVSAPPVALRAQSAAETGTLIVRVRDDSLPLAGAIVRSGRHGGVADSGGIARLELPGGLTRVLVTRTGYRPWSFEITIVPNAPQTVDAMLTRLDGEPDRAVALITRNTVRSTEDPVQVDVVSGRSVTHAIQLHPNSLSRLFDQLPFVRAQSDPGPLAGTRLRVRGLDGRYLGFLIDGLPLLSGAPSTFAVPQLSPFDVEHAELVSGPATALYGPSALGGVVNLVSRPADRNKEILAVNQSSEKGGDAMFWGARRLSPTVSGTLTADFHQQRLVDADDDQWGEFPRSIRFSIRPRLYVERASGDQLFATAGVMSEDRTGGFLLSNTDDDPYREELRTRRFDLGLRARRALGHTGRVEVKLSGMLQSSSHRFDDVREGYRRAGLFGEATWRETVGGATVVAGVAFQQDQIRHRQLPAFDYTYRVPSVFGQVTYAASARVAGTLSGRCDYHNVFGAFCTPRLSVLLLPASGVHARVGLGTGYYAPSPLDAHAEVLGLREIVPGPFNFERGRGATLDLGLDRGPMSLSGQVAYFHIARPVRLVPSASDPTRLRLVNADGPARVFSSTLTATVRYDALVFSGWYLFLRGTEADPTGPGRRDIDYTPRHTVGIDLAWRGPPTGTWAEVRAVHHGPQMLWDNPFRTRAPSFTEADVLVSQPMGRARLYVSAENIFDVKQRSYEPILLAAPAPGGQRTTTPWTLVRGRVVSLGAMVEW